MKKYRLCISFVNCTYVTVVCATSIALIFSEAVKKGGQKEELATQFEIRA